MRARVRRTQEEGRGVQEGKGLGVSPIGLSELSTDRECGVVCRLWLVCLSQNRSVIECEYEEIITAKTSLPLNWDSHN